MSALKAFSGGKRRPINLFFTEMIIVLLFFSISGAVILKVFASAELKSLQSARLERVMITAQSIAEAYSESGDLTSAAKLVLGDDVVIGETTLLLSDTKTEFHGVGTSYTTLLLENGSISMRAQESGAVSDAGGLYHLTMTFDADGEEIYSLSCSAYIRNGGEER
ncbi:MAG: hypothetical protein K2N38_14500 [Oscillospiraceae bacterium]|nr:hypothetical protein [Oscillospiraceae bacterium]